jgi:hypothetical protein
MMTHGNTASHELNASCLIAQAVLRMLPRAHAASPPSQILLCQFLCTLAF